MYVRNCVHIRQRDEDEVEGFWHRPSLPARVHEGACQNVHEDDNDGDNWW